MVPPPSLIAYLASTFLLVVTPGASTAVVIRSTLLGGPSSGMAAAAGVAVGNTSYAVASGVGLSVLLRRWPAAPRSLGLAGALYFVWLGASSLGRAVWWGQRADVFSETKGPAVAGARDESFRQGVGVNLLNPAIASFYFGIVPSFVPAGAAWWYFATLAALHVSMAFALHSLWALALGRVRHIFDHHMGRRLLEALIGVTMLLLAARVLWGTFKSLT